MDKYQVKLMEKLSQAMKGLNNEFVTADEIFPVIETFTNILSSIRTDIGNIETQVNNGSISLDEKQKFIDDINGKLDGILTDNSFKDFKDKVERLLSQNSAGIDFLNKEIDLFKRETEFNAESCDTQLQSIQDKLTSISWLINLDKKQIDILKTIKPVDTTELKAEIDSLRGEVRNLPRLYQRAQGPSGPHFIETPIKAGSNVTVTKDASGAWVITSTGGGGGSGYQSATGSVNGSNKSFTFGTAPSAISVDGVTLQKNASDGTANWTGTTTITLTVAPNFDIFAIA